MSSVFERVLNIYRMLVVIRAKDLTIYSTFGYFTFITSLRGFVIWKMIIKDVRLIF